MKKILAKLIGIITTLISIILVLILIVTLVQKLSGNLPEFLGYRIMYVLTGSMEPEIKTGDAILVKNTEVETLEAGDIVCYIAESGVVKGNAIVHRVVKPVYEQDGQKYLVTKGDANSTEDSPIHAESIVGIVLYRFRVLGKLFTFFKSIWGLIILVVPILIMIIKEIIEVVATVKESERHNK